MSKQKIRITEAELHQIIQESVNAILTESMDEGMWDTAKSFFGQYKNRGVDKAKEMGKNVGQQAKKTYNNVNKAVNAGVDKAKEMGKNVVNDVKQTYRNAQQDSQKIEMQKAFNNFKTAVEKFKAAGGRVNGQLNSRIAGIDKMLGGIEPHA